MDTSTFYRKPSNRIRINRTQEMDAYQHNMFIDIPDNKQSDDETEGNEELDELGECQVINESIYVYKLRKKPMLCFISVPPNTKYFIT